MAEMIAQFIMEAQVTAKIGAEAHERTPERTTQSQRISRAALGHAAGDDDVERSKSAGGRLRAEFHRAPKA
jgi:hypothetical protein